MAIYLRFIADNSIESRVIKYGTRWWTSHVEYIRTDGDKPVDTLGSRVGDGVQIRPADYCRPTREEWWTAYGIEDAYRIASTVIGSKYDKRDILGFIFSRDWHVEGHTICSELIDWSFKKVNQPLTNIWIPSWRVSPRDILVSPIVKYVRRIT